VVVADKKALVVVVAVAGAETSEASEDSKPTNEPVSLYIVKPHMLHFRPKTLGSFVIEKRHYSVQRGNASCIL
jgi:hypothetical protein